MQLCSERLLHLAFVCLRALLTGTNSASACRDLCHVLCSLLLHSPQRYVGVYAGMCGLLTLLNSSKAELSVFNLCLAGSCRVASTLATWQSVRMVPATCMGSLFLILLLVLNQSPEPSAVCFAFFLLLGFIGWRASLMFVRHIYRVSGFCPVRIAASTRKLIDPAAWPCRPLNVSDDTVSQPFSGQSRKYWRGPLTALRQTEGARSCCRSEQGPCTDV